MEPLKAIVIPGGAVKREGDHLFIPNENIFKNTYAQANIRDPRVIPGGIVNEQGIQYDPDKHIALDAPVYVMGTMGGVERKEDLLRIPMDKLAVTYIPPSPNAPWGGELGALLLNERHSKFIQDIEKIMLSEEMHLTEIKGRKQYFAEFSWDSSRKYQRDETTIEIFETGSAPMWNLAAYLDIRIKTPNSADGTSLMDKVEALAKKYV